MDATTTGNFDCGLDPASIFSRTPGELSQGELPRDITIMTIR
jgi:hypothetical protein